MAVTVVRYFYSLIAGPSDWTNTLEKTKIRVHLFLHDQRSSVSATSPIAINKTMCD